MQAETFSQYVTTTGHVQKKMKVGLENFIAKLTYFRFYQAKTEQLNIGNNHSQVTFYLKKAQFCFNSA